MKRGIICLAFVAVGLLVVDRVLRIQPYLMNRGLLNEEFQMPVLKGGRARACGVGMGSCPKSTKCGNGLCISVDPQPLVEKYPLPVLP